MKLSLASFNICHGLGMDGEQNFGRTIDTIRHLSADLVGLQEVDRYFGPRSDWQDQAAALGEALGMEVVFGSNLDLDPDPEHPGTRRQYGTAILSRYPVTFSRNHRLPQIIVPGAWNEARGLLEAHIDIKGRSVRFINTHLGLTAEERMAQTDVLEHQIKSGLDRHAATLVTGDFNALPGSPELAGILNVMKDSYAEVHEGQRTPTFMLKVDGRITDISCIDYIWCSANVRVNRAEAIRTYVSDHLPLTAYIEMD